MNERVKLIFSAIIILVVLFFTTNEFKNVSSLHKNVEINRYSLYSNIKDYNDTIKEIITLDNEYNNIDYSISSDINEKSIRLDENIKEGDIEKINNSFSSLINSYKNLSKMNFYNSNEFFSFLILETKLHSIEIKIFIAQQNYNNSVNLYNKTITSFPINIFSIIYGYDNMIYFETN